MGFTPTRCPWKFLGSATAATPPRMVRRRWACSAPRSPSPAPGSATQLWLQEILLSTIQNCKMEELAIQMKAGKGLCRPSARVCPWVQGGPSGAPCPSRHILLTYARALCFRRCVFQAARKGNRFVRSLPSAPNEQSKSTSSCLCFLWEKNPKLLPSVVKK